MSSFLHITQLREAHCPFSCKVINIHKLENTQKHTHSKYKLWCAVWGDSGVCHDRNKVCFKTHPWRGRPIQVCLCVAPRAIVWWSSSYGLLLLPAHLQPIPPALALSLSHTRTHTDAHTFSSHSCLAIYASANQYVQFWRNTASPWQPGLLSYGEPSCEPCSLVSVPTSSITLVILWLCIFLFIRLFLCFCNSVFLLSWCSCH